MNPPGATRHERHATNTARVRHAALLLLCASALTAGYIIGARGHLAQALGQHASPLTPLARVGFALQSDKLLGENGDWQRLKGDLTVVRAEWEPQTRGILDLIVAVRGLENGHPDWEGAEQLCRGLGWPRCDQPALEQLQRRSRP